MISWAPNNNSMRAEITYSKNQYSQIQNTQKMVIRIKRLQL